ncbi:MAG: glycosyltransferase family 4 protein, partial [Proteobacteria bacterium]|nr:glycosyltransferase family 4 protein [Pseudomonadota bacterium]
MNLKDLREGKKALEAVADKPLIIPEELKELKVAIVHYWLVTWRGGEKVLESILDLFPKADIYTLFYDPDVCGKYLQGHRVSASKLDYPFLRKHYQKVFPLYPYGIRSLKLEGSYDLLISGESGPAKGIANPDNIPHLCYINSPMRYCWGYRDEYLQAMPGWSRSIADRAFESLRKWDETTINNVDHYVANSKNVAKRVNKYYQRDADVCYPPISLDLFDQELQNRSKKHFLSFGAVTPYKNIDLLIDTFNENGLPLVVIGEGSERKKLEQKANSNIQFLGQQPWAKVISLINESRALLFPGEEDFGMIPLEVMSQGIPVIAYNKGGALETVVENISKPENSSGLFFETQDTN